MPQFGTTVSSAFRKFLRLAAAAAVCAIAGSSARADYVYAYAQQEIQALKITATTGTFTTSNNGTSTATGAVLEPGNSEGHVNVLDALQSYVGPNPRPAENTFSPILTSSNPPIPGNFARGDTVLTNVNPFNSPGIAANSVAESALTPDPEREGRGNGDWTSNWDFTLSQNSNLNLLATFGNTIQLDFLGPKARLAQATNTFVVTIVDIAADKEVFSWVPIELNSSHSLLTDGTFNQHNDNGSLSGSSTNTLLAGTAYRLTVFGASAVHTRVVPEPSSLSLIGLGLVGLIGYERRRRNRASA